MMGKRPNDTAKPLTNRETATILCALRLFQDSAHGNWCEDHFEEETPLSDAEIDDLCERLNFREA